MKTNSLNRPKNLEDVVQEFFLMFTIFFLLLLSFAILGIFFRWLVFLTLFLLLVAVGLRIWYLKSFRETSFSRWQKGILLFLLVVTLFNAFYHHSIPSSRDNIGYLTAGIMLAKEGKLHFQDIISRAYHPYRLVDNLGKDVFTSQFLPGYNTFLGFWYHLGGLNLVFWGNAVLLLLFLICLYGVACKITGQRVAALLSLLFTITFFAFLWFPRRTNSENLFMVLIWFSLWLFLRGVENRPPKFCKNFGGTPVPNKNLRRVMWGFLPISLTILVRGEGLLYLATFSLAFLFVLWKFKRQMKKERLAFASIAVRKKPMDSPSVKTGLNLGRSALLFLFPLAAIILFLRYLALYNGSYIWGHAVSILYNFGDFIVLWIPVNLLTVTRYAVIYKVFIFLGLILLGGVIYLIYRFRQRISVLSWKFPKKFSKGQFFLGFILTFLLIFNLTLISHYHWQEFVNWQTYRIQYVFIILGKYFLLPYFIIFLIRLWGPRFLNQGFYYTAFILSPVVVFILDPFVGLDQPWFLRRFYPTLIPFLFVLAAWGLLKLKLGMRARMTIIILLLAINLWVASPVLFFREYQGVQKELEDLVPRFEKNSLILMDPGWQWQQWGYALHYIYGLDVLPEYDRFSAEEMQRLIQSHREVYVVSKKGPEAKNIIDYPGFPQDKLQYLDEIRLFYPVLLSTTNLTDYIQDKETAVSTVVLLQKYQEALPREKDIEDTTLYIYRYK